MPLSATVKVTVAAEHQQSIDLGTASLPLSVRLAHAFTDGTGADQVKELFSDTRTLSASANESLDLSGVLTNVFGAAIAFTKIKALLVLAAASNTNDVLVGGASSNGFVSWVNDATDIVRVKPGGAFLITAPDNNGLAVTAGTGDILRIANSAGSTSVTYSIVILGVA